MALRPFNSNSNNNNNNNKDDNDNNGDNTNGNSNDNNNNNEEDNDNDVDKENLNDSTGNMGTPFLSQVQCKLDEFENIVILGVGSFGRVNLVRDPYTKKTYSLKKVRKNKVIETGQEDHVQNERDVFDELDNDFCCKMYVTYQDKLNIYFLIEAVLVGDLFIVLRWNKRFSEKTASFYAIIEMITYGFVQYNESNG
ncbi:hypothetical protein RFI_33059 [Reticulomyxa filosa]|uniref:Protein kinase domain-containing protein n=1 Tax=Reticulomyxa filosa TaxID=46433 RepID=X6LR42_RETFI|nr:hypothetical protein RFI_33059 [Reticulomyxa filosa]|eukprot:ETO04338.1 hypothetical protein RFI_33059 [Reticulomyxa filosa]